MTPTNRPRRGLITAAAVLAVVPTLLAVPAHADPPPNDDITGAIEVTLTSTTAFDTTEATQDATSTQRCVGDNSVWFRFIAAATQQVRMTTAGSSFATMLGVFQGRRSNLRPVDCDTSSGPGKTSADRFRIEEGRRYWIAVSSANDEEGGGPGELRIGRNPASAEVVVEGASSGGASGRLFVFGTATCAGPSEIRVFGTASQRVGDNVARGGDRTPARLCGEEPIEWRLVIDSETGWAFQPGAVSLKLTTSVWNGLTSTRRTMTTTTTAVDDPDARPAP